MHPTLLFISFPGFWGIHLNPAPRQYLGSLSYYKDDDDDDDDVWWRWWRWWWWWWWWWVILFNLLQVYPDASAKQAANLRPAWNRSCQGLRFPYLIHHAKCPIFNFLDFSTETLFFFCQKDGADLDYFLVAQKRTLLTKIILRCSLSSGCKSSLMALRREGATFCAKMRSQSISEKSEIYNLTNLHFIFLTHGLVFEKKIKNNLNPSPIFF